jgi:uncharacterized protein (TIGR02145 family)
VQCCQDQGVTAIISSAFNPCTTAATGSTWTIKDARDSKTYKVEKMPDGRYWMVEDLRFGNCTATSFKNDNSAGATTVTPTVATGYVGHCRTHTNANYGYMYNWAGAMNNVNAYYGSSVSTFQCAGTTTAANVCRGVCPEGWHLPTTAEYQDANSKFATYWKCSGAACWQNYDFKAVASGWAMGASNGEITNSCNGYYMASGYSNNIQNMYLRVGCDGVDPARGNGNKNDGRLVRCIRNY